MGTGLVLTDAGGAVLIGPGSGLDEGPGFGLEDGFDDAPGFGLEDGFDDAPGAGFEDDLEDDVEAGRTVLVRMVADRCTAPVPPRATSETAAPTTTSTTIAATTSARFPRRRSRFPPEAARSGECLSAGLDPNAARPEEPSGECNGSVGLEDRRGAPRTGAACFGSGAASGVDPGPS